MIDARAILNHITSEAFLMKIMSLATVFLVVISLLVITALSFILIMYQQDLIKRKEKQLEEFMAERARFVRCKCGIQHDRICPGCDGDIIRQAKSEVFKDFEELFNDIEDWLVLEEFQEDISKGSEIWVRFGALKKNTCRG